MVLGAFDSRELWEQECVAYLAYFLCLGFCGMGYIRVLNCGEQTGAHATRFCRIFAKNKI
jgi:hypothetical protein